MEIISNIIGVIGSFVSWLWGIPILIILIGGGVLLSAAIGGVQFFRLGFIFKNTVGKLFDKEEQARKRAAGISPVQAVVAALAGTIGTGNIVGVGAAIALGGPGAMFWMWVCGFMAMAIKYSEVTLSVMYRQKTEDGSYRAGPFMYMKEGLGFKTLAYIFGIMALISISIIAAIHANSITSNLVPIGASKYVICLVLVVFAIMVILGGMKGLVKITDKLVPIMTVTYIFISLLVMIFHVGNIGTMILEIFRAAFTGQAAVGGFTGVTVVAAVRWGLARGVSSNDAGLGVSASMQAQAESIDHPAQQGMWAVIETFLVTIIICSLTGFMILSTGVWQNGGDGATFAADALCSTFGVVGQWICILCLFLFGLSSLVGIVQSVKISAVSSFNSPVLGTAFQILVLLLIIGGCLGNLSSIFVFADLASGIILLLNVPTMILLWKPLHRTTKEWFGNNGNLEAIARQRMEHKK